MPKRTLAAAPLRIPLTIPFRHATADRRASESVVTAIATAAGVTGFGEGCPRRYVTGETVTGALAFIRRNSKILNVANLADLRDWIANNSLEIDHDPAAFCALETAMIDVLARERSCSAEALLGLPELSGAFHYSAVIGDTEPAVFKRQFERYWDAGFRDFKIKLSGVFSRDRAKFAAIRDHDDGSLRLRADANNFWHDGQECVSYIRSLDFPLFALEEPVRAADFNGLLYIAETLQTRMVLDESFLKATILDGLRSSAAHWIVNCRVSKLGGLIRTLDAITEARRLGISIIVGAHVGETSLLSRAALTAAIGAGTDLMAQEGAFGMHLLKYDPFRPMITFGRAGALTVDRELNLGLAGWGLEPADAPVLFAPAASADAIGDRFEIDARR